MVGAKNIIDIMIRGRCIQGSIRTVYFSFTQQQQTQQLRSSIGVSRVRRSYATYRFQSIDLFSSDNSAKDFL